MHIIFPTGTKMGKILDHKEKGRIRNKVREATDS